VLTCSEDFTAVIWETETSRQLTRLLTHEHQVTHGAFSPDDRWVALGCRDKTARVWDAQTGEPLTPPFRHPLDVFFVQWAEGTQRLVTRTRDGKTRAWSLPRDHRPVEDLSLIAQLLSSERSLASETMKPEDRSGLSETWGILRIKYPQEFSFGGQ
jgi:WD40 repeat protein